MRVCRPAIFAWSVTNNFQPPEMKALAKRLASEFNFSAAEILAMPFSEMVWWLTD
ncbi:hypothetical protein GHO35_13360 [Pseudomonas helleri]|nr:hypothetical protein [Pseudomonas helleri]